MKKLLAVLLAVLMTLSLTACKTNQNVEDVAIEEEVIQQVEEKVEEPVAGGWNKVEDGTITDELKDIFDSALKGLLGATYEPIELLETQVVAGTNYKFLAKGTKTTNPPVEGTYNIKINKDLDGNTSVLDIEVVEEKQIEKQVQDVTQTSFWIVFYDQYGNELQRTVEKYGTVPSFKGALPEGFVSWDKELKSITTNTYIKAVCKSISKTVDDGMPKKGDIITLNDSKKYRVLAMNGSKAKVLGLYITPEEKSFEVTLGNNDPAREIYLDNVERITYFGELCDTYLEVEWFNSLPTEIQNAIVPTQIDNSAVDSNLQVIAKSSKQQRRVYCMDIDDIYGYLGKTSFTIEELKEMAGLGDFLTSPEGENIYLRTVDSSSCTYRYDENFGIESHTNGLASPLQPEFVIDLNAQDIEFTIINS